jgi:hypothetical protein
VRGVDGVGGQGFSRWCVCRLEVYCILRAIESCRVSVHCANCGCRQPVYVYYEPSSILRA